MFRVTHILYTKIGPLLCAEENRELRSKLGEVVMWGSLQAIARFIGTPMAKTIAIGIGSYIDLPTEPGEVAAQRQLTAGLCDLQSVVDSDEYSTLLTYLFSQKGSGEAVLAQVITMLSPEDDGATIPTNAGTAVTAGDESCGTVIGCNTLLGLHVLDRILSVREVREMAFEFRSQVVKILKTLRGLVAIAMDRVASGPLPQEEEEEEDGSDDGDGKNKDSDNEGEEKGLSELETVMVLAVTYYAKLLIHFIAMREEGGDSRGEDEGDEDGNSSSSSSGNGEKSVFAREAFCNLVRWTCDVCLPQAMRYGGMCDGLVRAVAIISAELVVVGLGDESLIGAIAELYRHCLVSVAETADSAARLPPESEDFASELLPHISKFIYHLYYYDTERDQRAEGSDNEDSTNGSSSYESISLSILEQILRSLPLSLLEKRLQIQDIINTQSANGTLRVLQSS